MDTYEPIFDRDLTVRELTMTWKFIKEVERLRELVRKHNIYTFTEVYNTDAKPRSIYNNNDLPYIKDLLNKDISTSVDDNNVEEFEKASKILETEVMPGIAQATAEMMAFSNFILAVYNEMSNQAS